MPKVDLNTIKTWFKTGLKPTQLQFWNVFDSFRHKDSKIPLSEVDGAQAALDSKANKSDTHSTSVADARFVREIIVPIINAAATLAPKNHYALYRTTSATGTQNLTIADGKSGDKFLITIAEKGGSGKYILRGKVNSTTNQDLSPLKLGGSYIYEWDGASWVSRFLGRYMDEDGHALSSLGDVDMSHVSAGAILIYDDAAKKWKVGHPKIIGVNLVNTNGGITPGVHNYVKITTTTPRTLTLDKGTSIGEICILDLTRWAHPTGNALPDLTVAITKSDGTTFNYTLTFAKYGDNQSVVTFQWDGTSWAHITTDRKVAVTAGHKVKFYDKILAGSDNLLFEKNGKFYYLNQSTSPPSLAEIVIPNISGKADKSYVDSENAKQDIAINSKADKSTTYTEAEVDAELAKKADKTALATKANTSLNNITADGKNAIITEAKRLIGNHQQHWQALKAANLQTNPSYTLSDGNILPQTTGLKITKKAGVVDYQATLNNDNFIKVDSFKHATVTAIVPIPQGATIATNADGTITQQTAFSGKGFNVNVGLSQFGCYLSQTAFGTVNQVTMHAYKLDKTYGVDGTTYDRAVYITMRVTATYHSASKQNRIGLTFTQTLVNSNAKNGTYTLPFSIYSEPGNIGQNLNYLLPTKGTTVDGVTVDFNSNGEIEVRDGGVTFSKLNDRIFDYQSANRISNVYDETVVLNKWNIIVMHDNRDPKITIPNGTKKGDFVGLFINIWSTYSDKQIRYQGQFSDNIGSSLITGFGVKNLLLWEPSSDQWSLRRQNTPIFELFKYVFHFVDESGGMFSIKNNIINNNMLKDDAVTSKKVKASDFSAIIFDGTANLPLNYHLKYGYRFTDFARFIFYAQTTATPKQTAAVTISSDEFRNRSTPFIIRGPLTSSIGFKDYPNSAEFTVAFTSGMEIYKIIGLKI